VTSQEVTLPAQIYIIIGFAYYVLLLESQQTQYNFVQLVWLTMFSLSWAELILWKACSWLRLNIQF